MTVSYRLVVHCDENASNKCQGLEEYLSADRIGLARMSDRHMTELGLAAGLPQGIDVRRVPGLPDRRGGQARRSQGARQCLT